MARQRDPVDALTEQIEKLEKSLGTLDRRMEYTGDEYAKAAKELARAEAQRQRSIDAGVAPQVADRTSRIEHFQTQFNRAEDRSEGASDRYDEVAKSLARMREELVETAKEMEKERLRRSGAARVFAGAANVASGVAGVGGGVAGVLSGRQSLGEGAARAGAGVAQAAEGVGQVGTGAAKVLGDLAGAAQGAAGAFMGFAGQVSGFVQAFSPATVELFQLAVRDLTAVIGSALQPVLAAMTGVVRQVSASLLPVAEAMAPVFETLSGVMLKVLTPALDTLAAVVQSMVPVFEVLADVVDALTPLLRIGQTLMAGWVQLFTDLISSLMPSKEGVKGFVEQFAEAMRELSASVLKVVAFIARSLGGLSFIDGMIKSLTGTMAKKKPADGAGAPTGAAFTSVTDFGKQVATRAFLATGEPEKNKTSEEWLAKLSKDLDDIKSGEGTLEKFLEVQLDRLAKSIAAELGKLIPSERVYDSARTVAEVAAASGGSPLALAGNVLGRYIFGS